MEIIMGRTHRAVAAAPSRRLLVLRLSVVPRLVPGPDGGGGRETKRGGGGRVVRWFLAGVGLVFTHPSSW